MLRSPCSICGEAVSGAHPDDDVCCASCYALNLAEAVHLEPPVVRPTLTLTPRDVQALLAYQRHVARQGEGDTPHG